MPQTLEQPDESGLDLSVVIPAFNAARTIKVQLEALQHQHWSGSWEVVVTDNGSTDDTRSLVETVRGADDRMRSVDASDRPGAAHARNRGVQAARGRSIAFCDADDVVGEGWLAAMGDGLRRTAFVTGPQEYERLNPTWLHAVYGSVAAHQMQTFSGIFPFAPTANLGVHRALFEQVGGFDESISVGEDVELCLRLWLQGVELEFLPGAVVHYRYRERLAPLWTQAVKYGAVTPDIGRRLAAAGQPTPSPWRGARNWIWLVRKLPSLRTKAGRARWLVVAGGCAGRIAGSVRSRYIVL